MLPHVYLRDSWIFIVIQSESLPTGGPVARPLRVFSSCCYLSVLTVVLLFPGFTVAYFYTCSFLKCVSFHLRFYPSLLSTAHIEPVEIKFLVKSFQDHCVIWNPSQTHLRFPQSFHQEPSTKQLNSYASGTVLKRSGESAHPCLLPDFNGIVLKFSSFRIILAVGCHWNSH